MKRITISLFLAAVAFAADVVIVANPSVKASEISAEELKLVFLGTKTALSDGSAVEPVLAQSGAIHEAFLKSYVGKSDAALRNYYKTLVFTGKGSMPKSFASDAEIVAFVAKTKGAIGYLGAPPTGGGVKRINVK
jgi:ABC-type phosphate transport system substrate-binding protein